MEIFNIGPGELIFILVMMIVLLGPKEMIRLARRAGEWIRAVRQSSIWQEVRKWDREARALPYKLAREAGFDEQMEEIRRGTSVSLDIYPLPEQKPETARSPGGRRLRPPQPRGAPLTHRTVSVEEGSKQEQPQEPNSEQYAGAVNISGETDADPDDGGGDRSLGSA